jgi:hypothetical protein
LYRVLYRDPETSISQLADRMKWPRVGQVLVGGGDLVDVDEVRVARAAIAPADGVGVCPITLTVGDGTAPVGRPGIFKVAHYS